jgi:mono/diheme cytochrome c family protein
MNEVQKNQEQDALAAFAGLIVLFAVLAVMFIVSTPNIINPPSVAAANTEISASQTPLATELPTATIEPTATPLPTVADNTSNAASNSYPPELVALGQTLFVTCSACHGPDGRGIIGLGKDLVTGEFVLTATDADLVTLITTGRPIWDAANTTGIDMPAKGGNPTLTQTDIEAIVAYIRSLQNP